MLVAATFAAVLQASAPAQATPTYEQTLSCFQAVHIYQEWALVEVGMDQAAQMDPLMERLFNTAVRLGEAQGKSRPAIRAELNSRHPQGDRLSSDPARMSVMVANCHAIGEPTSPQP